MKVKYDREREAAIARGDLAFLDKEIPPSHAPPPDWLNTEAARRAWKRHPGYRRAAYHADVFNLALREEIVERADQFAIGKAKGLDCSCSHNNLDVKAKWRGQAVRFCFLCGHLVRFNLDGEAVRCEPLEKNKNEKARYSGTVI